MWKRGAAKSHFNSDCCGYTISKPSLSMDVIRPVKEKTVCGNERLTRMGMDLAFSFMRAEIACSADEILFIAFVRDHGFQRAVQLAAIHDLRCMRPLHALLAAAPKGKRSGLTGRKGNR